MRTRHRRLSKVDKLPNLASINKESGCSSGFEPAHCLRKQQAPAVGAGSDIGEIIKDSWMRKPRSETAKLKTRPNVFTLDRQQTMRRETHTERSIKTPVLDLVFCTINAWFLHPSHWGFFSNCDFISVPCQIRTALSWTWLVVSVLIYIYCTI